MERRSTLFVALHGFTIVKQELIGLWRVVELRKID